MSQSATLPTQGGVPTGHADLDQLRRLDLPTQLEQQQRRESPAMPAADGPRLTNTRQVSIGSGMLGGTAAFVGGFVLAGAAHYWGSAGKLREEGIDPRVRLKSFPLALRALAVSTAMCGVLGALGVAAIHIGLQVQPVANISSVADAISLARQQRPESKKVLPETRRYKEFRESAVVQGEFQARLHPDAHQQGQSKV